MKSKISPYPTRRWIWPPRTCFASLQGVRWLGAITLLSAAASIARAAPSNPAFLGIGMQDANPPSGGPCIVTEITRGSGAKAAGIQKGDFLTAIDDAGVPNCDAVLRTVQGHQPGDTVKLHVVRGGRQLLREATLVSRDEIMRRRLVGQQIMATDLYTVDDERSLDLSALKGKTVIVGWFDARSCAGCTAAFGQIAKWARAQGDPPTPIAVMLGEPRDPKWAMPTGLDVPLALADQKTYEEVVVPDRERINFMVIDGRGVVQYVAPIMPTADDAEASIDELFAATEQASRRAAK